MAVSSPPRREAGAGEPRIGQLEAARRLGLGGEWGRAGEIYVRAGALLKAAEAFERACDCDKSHRVSTSMIAAVV